MHINRRDIIRWIRIFKPNWVIAIMYVIWIGVTFKDSYSKAPKQNTIVQSLSKRNGYDKRWSVLDGDWPADFLMIITIDIQIKINRWNDTKHQPHHFQWDFGNFSIVLRRMVKKEDDDKVIYFEFNKIFIELILVLFKLPFSGQELYTWP